MTLTGRAATDLIRREDARVLPEEFSKYKVVIHPGRCNGKTEMNLVLQVLGKAQEKIDAAPTIDAVPVVHAENVTPTHYSDEFVCSYCGFCCEITEIRHDDVDDFGMGEASAHEYECKFCPDCGAKMDGGASDG